MEFKYKAKTEAGTDEQDVIQASNRAEAISELRSRGLTPVFIVEHKSSKFDLNKIFASITSVSLLDKITFLRNLSVMIKAGVPVPRALSILSTQSENEKFKTILSNLSHDVQTGKALSEAIGTYPEIFGPLYVNLVRVGEAGGNLDRNLDYLVGYLRRDYELMKKTKGAMTYPIVVFAALVLVVILMFTFILPKLVDTFTELNVELPILTRILIAVVNAFANYSYLIILGLIAAVAGTRFYFRTDAGRALGHTLTLNLPIMKKATKQLNLARFTLTLSSLLASGMPIVEALKVAGNALTNMHYSNSVMRAAEKVKRGVTLSDSFAGEEKLFPTIMVQMIKVGEESGTIESILKELNTFYEEELDQFIKNLSSIIEPLMVVVIGVVVGFLALALITPIYSISQNV